MCSVRYWTVLTTALCILRPMTERTRDKPVVDVPTKSIIMQTFRTQVTRRRRRTIVIRTDSPAPSNTTAGHLQCHVGLQVTGSSPTRRSHSSRLHISKQWEWTTGNYYGTGHRSGDCCVGALLGGMAHELGMRAVEKFPTINTAIETR